MTLSKTLLAVVALTFAQGGDDWSALVEQALDQPTSLTFENVPLADAFDQIVRDTGVEVSISQDTLDLLPYGRNTRLSAQIQNVSLREGLRQTAEPLGLVFAVRNRGIELIPTPALDRIGRRATWDELELLADLLKRGDQDLSSRVDALMGQMRFEIAEADNASAELRAALLQTQEESLAKALSAVCDSMGWCWHPAGQAIVIVDKMDQQLRTSVSLRQTSRKLIDVLQALGRAGRVRVGIEPDALAMLSLRTRQNFSIYVENKAFGDALQLVSATTGLGYRVDPDGIMFYRPSVESQDSQASDKPAGVSSQSQGSGNPYVGKILLPEGADGTRVELLLRESDLTPEVNELRRRHLHRANQAIKEALLELERSSDNL